MLAPGEGAILTVLEYLLHLREQGLATASLRVHLAAIAAFHPGEGQRSIFANPMVKRFLKGIDRMMPYERPPVSPWDLNLVLTALMKLPFEPLASCSLKHLSYKVAS